MTHTIDYRRLAITATLTSFAAFAYFTGVGVLLDPQSSQLLTISARAAASAVVGTLLAVRLLVENGTGVDAAREGFLLAVIVVMANGLLGSEMLGKAFAIRSAGVLLGLPLLAVVAHVLGQKRSRPYSD